MERARQPDRGALRARTGACSWPPRRASSTSSTASRTRRRRSSPTCAPGPRLLGPRAARAGDRPRLHTGRPYVYVLYSHDTAPWGDSCPTARGPTADGCMIDGRLSRLDAAGARDRADRGLLPAVPEPLGRHARVRPRRDALPERGRGRALRLRGLRPDRGNPCGDPPNADGAIGPPDSQGGALRAQASGARPASRSSLDGAILRIDPDAPDVQRPLERRRLRLPQPVPLHVPAGHERDLDGRRRLERLGGDQPRPGRRHGAQLRLAVLRGRRRDSPATTRSTSTTCETLYAEGSATPPYFTYNHARHGRRRRRCATGRLVDLGVTLLHRHARSRRRTAAALFFGDYARDCIWFMPLGRRRRCPTRRRAQLFAGGAAGPVFLTEGPDGALYYADLDGGDDPPDRLRRADGEHRAPRPTPARRR